MIGYWQKFGFSTFLDGYFQLVNSEDYAVPLTEWIKGTAFEGKNTYHVFSRTWFGDLRVWGETTGRDFHLDILLDAFILRKKSHAPHIASSKANISGKDAFFDLDPKPGDLRDRLRRTAQQRLGSLGGRSNIRVFTGSTAGRRNWCRQSENCARRFSPNSAGRSK
ncbi:conserved hypothetical protein [Ruegeria sp. TrichCH4B]|nr:conserved hypothetical protein [Ruegeria sp. TrichCH4B]